MLDMDRSEWQREVNRHIDEQIEKHNTANQNEFRLLRDGQTTMLSDIKKLDCKVDGLDRKVYGLDRKVDATKAASETAHKEIIERLEQIDARLDNLENK